MRRIYNTTYKKNATADRDSYLFRRTPKGILSCRGCGAVYHHARWALDPTEEIRRVVDSGKGVRQTHCPACQKIRDHYAQGIVEITRVDAEEKTEILRLLKNEESRARGKNPLERILAIVNGAGGLRVETTTERLAQRFGRCLKKARGGKVIYKWSHRNKFARVFWENGPHAAAGIAVR
ncbi:MAG TPA: BCAM0308 family protein [Verrucomicrobiae bacterium]|nr:BCAM0308 family protein [Verrucomicrobiae bacterium]